jgi:acid phosphatase (class A)
MVLAMVLSEMLPDHKKALMAQGMQIGDDRALAGQHYPSDVDAGRVLAKAIFEKMEQDPKFRQSLEAAKAECAAKQPMAQAAK